MKRETADSISHHFTLDANRIYSERFEKDTIIIDLHTGIYFNLNYSASIIWEAISQGCSASDISQLLADKIGDRSQQLLEEIIGDVVTFLDELQQFGLVTLAETNKSNRPIDFDFEISKESYSPPAINAHSDVKDLILADIVHSIDPDGWPKITS